MRNVFLSFAMEDKPLVELFRGQAEMADSRMEFRDYSVKEPFEQAWKSNVEELIRLCSMTIVLVGRDTWKSEAVDWEIRKSHELGKQLVAVFVNGTDVRLPSALVEFNVPVYSWGVFLRRFSAIAS
jgi:hypothetical protein